MNLFTLIYKKENVLIIFLNKFDLFIIMLAALGSLASYAIPQLLTFASKKIMNTNLGSSVAKNLGSKGLRTIATSIGRNYKKMMNNNYNNQLDPYANA